MSVYVKTGLALLFLICAMFLYFFIFNVSLLQQSSPTVVKVETKTETKKKSLDLLPPVNGCTDQTTLKVMASLTEHPEDWTLGQFELERGMGWFDGPPLRIWISNADYGLDFNTDSSRFKVSGMKYPFTEECRAALYSVTSKFSELQDQRRFEEMQAELAEQRNDIVEATR